MIEIATPDRILGNDSVRRRIDLRNFIDAPKIHVNLSADGIILHHSRFTSKFQSFNDGVGVNIKDGYFFTERVGNVDFAEWHGIGAAIRFFTRGKFFDDLHLREADHADFVFSPITGVNLFEFRHVYGGRDSGKAMDRRDQLVRSAHR